MARRNVRRLNREVKLSLCKKGDVAQALLRASSAHVVVCSPVAGDHLSEMSLNGMRTAANSPPAGAVNLALKQPRESGMEPPPEHEYEGEAVPEANDTRKPA